MKYRCKICKDCKHYKKKWFDACCAHPNNVEINLVTGATMYKWGLETNRRDCVCGLCGSEGRWWGSRKRSNGRLDDILNEGKEE